NFCQLQKQVNKIKNLMNQGLENAPQSLVQGFGQIIKACEHTLISATNMKK
ncbi:hypothetical protein ACO22_02587, partial [Paracoccidioides brasiliensis]